MDVRKLSQKSADIRDFVLHNIRAHPADITRVTAAQFGLTRQATLRHIKALVRNGTLVATGGTKDRRYSLVPLAEFEITLRISGGPKEDVVWRQHIRPALEGVPSNVGAICQYGFTEILNNAIEHSEGNEITVSFIRYIDLIQIMIHDDGVGIFAKIARDLRLDDARHAILELTKGKLTTDPEHHAGEGVFFASRMFDLFSIFSGGLYLSLDPEGDDWLVESEHPKPGTLVTMEISPGSTRLMVDVFNRFSAPEDNLAFSRTHVVVALARYGDENLVSRSQARGLLARFDRFKEVILDFRGIDSIGQAFADEIFRVFQNAYPHLRLVPLNTVPIVLKMIERVKNPT